MNKGNLVVLLLLLMGGVTLAAVYKWVDESGRVHFGDSPPPESDAQQVEVPEGPSQEKVEQARQRMQEKLDQYEKFSEEARPSEPLEKPSQEADMRVVTPDNIACFAPLSDLVQGPSAETFTPITPTPLTKAQQKSLANLFDEGNTRLLWRGTISDLQCMGSPTAPIKSQIRNFEARTTMDWDVHKSRFTIETDTIGKESGVTKRLVHRFEVGDALYFNDASSGNLAQDGNKVEVLSLNQGMVTFFIKRRIRTALGTRIPRGEVWHLEISGRTLKLIELHYHNDMLTDSRTWILSR